MSPSAPRVLAVCADDYGMSVQVSEAIAGLADGGRLSHVSCLTNGSHWAASAPMLRALRGRIEAGLHFNLTDGQPLSRELAAVWPEFPGLARLILAAHLGRLPMDALRAEWAAQWNAFTEHAGEAPHFVDGHQHVHHLPGVRDVLLACLGAQTPAPAVRSTGRVAGPGFIIKRWALRHTGGRMLQAALKQHALRHNRVLLGVYDFESTDYRRLMQQWLQQVPLQGGLLFCHPGAAVPGDRIAAARVREHAYLASPEFSIDLAHAGVTLGTDWGSARSP